MTPDDDGLHPVPMGPGVIIVLVTRLSLAILMVLSVADVARARGRIDRTYGAGGKVIIPLLAGEVPKQIAFQGRDAVALSGTPGPLGNETGFGLHRVTVSGRLDRRFGRRGRVDGVGVATAIAVGPDGSVLVGTTSGTADPGGIARFDVNGSADGAFADGGVATLIAPFGNPVAMHVDSLGRVVAVDRGLRAVRLLADGRIDPTFGIRVLAAPAVDGVGWESATFAADGTLLAAGSHVATDDIFVARVLPDWRLDPAFGPGGGGVARFEGPPGPLRSPVRLAPRPDGGGVVTVFGGVLVRYSGWWMVAFDRVGAATARISVRGAWGTVAATRSGVFAGGGKEGCSCAPSRPLRTVLLRYTPTLQVDENFGHGGFLLSVVRSNHMPDIAIQQDGRVIVLTNVMASAKKVAAKMALQRYRP